MKLDCELARELIEDEELNQRETINEIPYIQRVIDSLGTRIKDLEDRFCIAESSLNHLNRNMSDEGVRNIKRETRAFVYTGIRNRINNLSNIPINSIRDLLNIFRPAKEFEQEEKIDSILN